MTMTKKNMIALWKKEYSNDQENLYKNFFIRTIFDIGHRYIARKGAKTKGLILDIGSGMGYHLKFENITKDRRYICLDSDPQMLKKISYPFVKTLVGTCGSIPLKDHTVDLIIASHILEHLPNLKNDLREIKRVLKKNGKVIIVLPADPGFLWNLLTYFSPSRSRLKKIGIEYDVVMRHEHVNTFSKCMTIIKKEFKILDESYYPFYIKNFHANLFVSLTVVNHHHE